MRSMDYYDDEVRYDKNEKLEVGFLISFKSMSIVIGRIIEETKEYDDKYPKSELLKIWRYVMGIFFVLFLCTYNLFAVVTIPFMIFYGYVLIQLFGAWKRFKYKRASLLLATIVGLILELFLGMLLQGIVFG